jgi:ParB/RepB/Spo0J family partition protein
MPTTTKPKAVPLPASVERIVELVPTPHLVYLKLDELQESPDNPRQHYDPIALAQLGATLQKDGMLTPIRAREMPKGKHIIAAGHRRYRAATNIAMAVVPVLLGPMSDEQFLAVLTIDNLQRDDLHPLEEGAGFRLMMEKLGYDPAAIAARIGQSKTYVYDRLRLLGLAKRAKALFLADRIQLGHAILLSRLTIPEQERIIGTDKHLGAGASNSSLLFDRDAGRSKKDQPEFALEFGLAKAVSVDELRRNIDRHVHFDATRSDVVDLFPETARLVAEAQATKARTVEITTAHQVLPEAKGTQRILGPASWTRADGREGSKECESAVVGVFVAGDQRGEAMKVCTSKQSCMVHYGREIRERKAREKKRGAGSGKTSEAKSGTAARETAERVRAEQKRAAAEIEKARWIKARPALLDAVETAVGKVKLTAKHPFGKRLIDEASTGWQLRQLMKTRKLKPGTTADELLRALLFLSIAGHLAGDWDIIEHAASECTKLGIDAKAIVEKVAPKKIEKVVPLTAAELAKLACEGCGCTDKKACKDGCTWSAKFAGVRRAVCSRCVKKVPALAA